MKIPLTSKKFQMDFNFVRKSSYFRQQGFTLVELLIVVAIIAILVSVAAASYSTAQRNARNAQRATDLHKIAAALEEFYADHGFYPSTRNGNNPNGRWESASHFNNADHTNCLLGGTFNTNFVPNSIWWDWCGMNPNNNSQGGTTIPASNTSNLPANIYIANGEFSKFPKDPLFKGIEDAYAYASNSQTYAVATRHYEGVAPSEYRFTGGEYWGNGSPWDADLQNGNQYIVRSPNHN